MALIGRKNAQSEFLGLIPIFSFSSTMKHVARFSRSRAAVDFSADIGEPGSLANKGNKRHGYGTRPAGLTIEKVFRPGDVDGISPAGFQHVLAMEFMKRGRKFDPSYETLQAADHGDYAFTAKMLEEIIPVEGGIDIALSPADVPGSVSRKAWGSSRSKEAFSKITRRQIDSDYLPPFLLSIATYDYTVSNSEGNSPKIINISRLNDIVDHVSNPFVIEHAIITAIDALHHNSSSKFPPRQGGSWAKDLDAVNDIAFGAKGDPATSAMVGIIERESSVGIHSFNVYDACNFLKRVSRGHDKMSTSPKKLDIKRRARALFDGKYCYHWTKYKKSPGEES